MSDRSASSFKNARQAFPDRLCEVCGRRGGGDPEGGLENVVVAHGRQLCGHHRLEFENWLAEQLPKAADRWITQKRSSQ